MHPILAGAADTLKSPITIKTNFHKNRLRR